MENKKTKNKAQENTVNVSWSTRLLIFSRRMILLMYRLVEMCIGMCSFVCRITTKKKEQFFATTIACNAQVS